MFRSQHFPKTNFVECGNRIGRWVTVHYTYSLHVFGCTTHPMTHTTDVLSMTITNVQMGRWINSGLSLALSYRARLLVKIRSEITNTIDITP